MAALAERGGEVNGAFMIKGHQKLVKIFNGAIDSSDAVIKEGAKLRYAFKSISEVLKLTGRGR